MARFGFGKDKSLMELNTSISSFALEPGTLFMVTVDMLEELTHPGARRKSAIRFLASQARSPEILPFQPSQPARAGGREAVTPGPGTGMCPICNHYYKESHLRSHCSDCRREVGLAPLPYLGAGGGPGPKPW